MPGADRPGRPVRGGRPKRWPRSSGRRPSGCARRCRRWPGPAWSARTRAGGCGRRCAGCNPGGCARGAAPVAPRGAGPHRGSGAGPRDAGRDAFRNCRRGTAPSLRGLRVRGWTPGGGDGRRSPPLVGGPAAQRVAPPPPRPGPPSPTDEITLLAPAAGTALPFPLPMAVKPWTAEAVGPLPEGSEVANEGSVRFYLPADRGAGPTSIRAFVLLRPGGRPELRPLSRAEVLMALGQHHSSLRYPHRLEDAFAGFSRLLRGARCYTLTAPSPAAAAELLTAAARAS